MKSLYPWLALSFAAVWYLTGPSERPEVSDRRPARPVLYIHAAEEPGEWLSVTHRFLLGDMTVGGLAEIEQQIYLDGSTLTYTTEPLPWRRLGVLP